MPDEPTPIDWSLTTWDGSRREQLRRWSQLTMDEILEAQEEMAELATEIGGDAALAVFASLTYQHLLRTST
jgi:hypothetical protein